MADTTISALAALAEEPASGDFFIVDDVSAGATKKVAHSYVKQAVTDHLADTADAHDASAISNTTTGTALTSTDVQAALAELDDAIRLVQIKVFDDLTTLSTGDGKVIFCVPSKYNGLNLVDADAYVTTNSSSGTPTVQIRNVTQAADMLSTRITIDANESTSYTAAAAPVIDTNNDDVATGDLIAVDVDVAGTGAKGLGVILQFGL